MLKVWGKLLTDGRIMKSETVESEKGELSAALLECIEKLCKRYDIEVPMWHTTHTKQIGIFRKVTFRKDDFMDKFPYDRFEVQILDEK